jgi:DNA-binding PadR family transcriptional regulator
MSFAWFDQKSRYGGRNVRWHGRDPQKLSKEQKALVEEYVVKTLEEYDHPVMSRSRLPSLFLKKIIPEVRNTERASLVPHVTFTYRKIVGSPYVHPPQYETTTEVHQGYRENHVYNALNRLVKRGVIVKAQGSSGSTNIALLSRANEEGAEKFMLLKEHRDKQSSSIAFLKSMFERWGLSSTCISNYPSRGIEISLTSDETKALADILRKLSSRK